MAMAQAAAEHCRTIAARDARLACYDRVFPPREDAAAGPGASAPALASAPGPAQEAPTPRVGVAVGGAGEAATFGLVARTKPAAELAEITSQIPGTFEGWTATTRWRLANGQLWSIADGSSGAYNLVSPRVRISRGLIGGYFMEIEGVSQSPKVRRLE
jgi:hypothetical protein